MSLDPKKFGLSDSLLSAVNEALKGNQHKLDKNKNGKLDSQDFKMLRKEDVKPDFLDLDKDGNKKEPMKQAAKQVKEDDDKHFAQQSKKMQDAINLHLRRGKSYADAVKASKVHVKEVADGNAKNFKTNMKEGPEEKDKTNPKQGSSVDPKQRSIGEAAPPVAATNVADQMGDRKAEIQRKIAQKQAAHQQSKSNKRIIGSIKENGKKCSCNDTNESKMKCEVHGGKEKGIKGGKEPIEINPALKEASDLPKKVITKGHEIAKSLIKHRAKVREPYAVGMATAKKSAGIKEETTDESVYPERHAAAKKTLGRVAKEKGGKVGFQSTTYKDGKRVTTHGHYNEKGERVVTHTTNEEAEQVDEISTMKAVRTAVKRQTDAYGDAIKRGDDLSDKQKHKVNRSQSLIKKKYGEKGDKIVYKAVGKRIGYQD